MANTLSVAAVLQYFPDNFASVNGISSVGGPLGMMTLPPLVQQLILLYGWRSSLALLGALSANYCVCAAVVRPLRTRNTYEPIAGSEQIPTTNPPYNESLWDNWRRKLRTLCEKTDLQMFVDELDFVTTMIINFLCGVSFCGWHIFLIPHGIALGFKETKSSFLATFGGLGGVFGRVLPGLLIDSGVLRAWDIFAGSAFLLAVVCFLDPVASPSYGAVAALTTIAGFCFGVFYPLLIVLSVSLSDKKRLSSVTWMFIFHGAGMLAGGFFSGEYRNMHNLFDKTRNDSIWYIPCLVPCVPLRPYSTKDDKEPNSGTAFLLQFLTTNVLNKPFAS